MNLLTMNSEHYENIMYMFPDHLCTIYAHDLEHYIEENLKTLFIWMCQYITRT